MNMRTELKTVKERLQRAAQRAGKPVLLALALAGMAILFSGCFSLHVDKESNPPPQVIVVPQDHPNP